MPIESGFEEERKTIESLIDGQISDRINSTVFEVIIKTDPHYQS